MSEYFDAVIFVDRRQAKLFHFNATDDVKLVFMHTSAKRRHHRADHEDATRHGEDDEFLHRVVGSLDHRGHTLITGPGNSKFELQAYMERHHPDLAARISGVETLDDAEDSGILALAHQFFRARGHRHSVVPEANFRHNDVSAKH
jgi:stalled ribosome rescue protein Dom34